MYQPSVTIVMPVYNAANTLDATIESVLVQTMDDFEFIIVDDGSTDESLAVLLAHASMDERIRVIRQRNGGVSRARNFGAGLGTAQYIAFIDADDLWVPEKLASHLALHRDQPQLSASYAKIAFIASTAASTSDYRTESRVLPTALQLLDVLSENPVCTASNFFIRRDAFMQAYGFDESLSHAEDQDLIAFLVANGALIESIDRVLVGYRFSPDGLSMDLDRMKAGWRTVAARYLSERDLAALEALYLRYLARRTLRSGGPATKALAYSREGLRIDARAFLANRRRGFATLAGAAIAPLLPSAIRRHVFA